MARPGHAVPVPPRPAWIRTYRRLVLKNAVVALVSSACLLTVPHGLPGATRASASVPVGAVPAAAAPVVPSAKPPTGTGWVEGWTVDRAGDPQLDVLVEAFRPADQTTPVASALSYSGVNAHGDEVDGFFRLQVPHGRYVLRLSSLPGARDPFRVLWFGRKDPVGVARGVADLGHLELTRARKAEPRTSVRLRPARVVVRRQATVAVAVRSPEVSAVRGRVEVTVAGKRVGTTILRGGSATYTLPRLRLGRHRVGVQYLGSDAVEPGRVATAVLSVVRR